MNVRRMGRAGSTRSWQRRTPRPGRNRRIAVACLAVAALGLLTWRWRIAEIRVTGGALTPNAVIRDAAYDRLQGNQWGIIPRTSVLFAPLRILRRELRRQFPLTDIRTSRHFSGTLDIRVFEPPPAGTAVFDGEQPAYLDAACRIIGRPNPTEVRSGLPVFRMTHQGVALGSSLCSEAAMRTVSLLWSTLQRAGDPYLPVDALPHAADADAFDIRTAGGYTVVMTTAESAESQDEKLNATLARIRVDPKGARVRSVDLRYGDRVFLQE